MRVFLDTSTLVGALVREHPAHSDCDPWLQAARRGKVEAVLCAHTLAELYATLTVLPMRPLPSPLEVREVLRQSVEPWIAIVEFQAADYHAALDRVAGALLRSGAIFDALLCVAAERSGATCLVTLNSRDFLRFVPRERAGWIVDPRGTAPPGG